MTHGRGQRQTVTIGGSKDGRVSAYRLEVVQDTGAYPRMAASMLPSQTGLMATGVYKIPDLLGPLGNHVRPQAVVGAACAFVAAYLSTKFLLKFFETRSLLPFGIYCLIAGGLCILRFA